MPELCYAYAKCNRTYIHCTIHSLVSSGNSHWVQIQNICSNCCEINLQCVFECVRTLRPHFSLTSMCLVHIKYGAMLRSALRCCAIPLAFVCSFLPFFSKHDVFLMSAFLWLPSPLCVYRCFEIHPSDKKERIKTKLSWVKWWKQWPWLWLKNLEINLK